MSVNHEYTGLCLAVRLAFYGQHYQKAQPDDVPDLSLADFGAEVLTMADDVAMYAMNRILRNYAKSSNKRMQSSTRIKRSTETHVVQLVEPDKDVLLSTLSMNYYAHMSSALADIDHLYKMHARIMLAIIEGEEILPDYSAGIVK